MTQMNKPSDDIIGYWVMEYHKRAKAEYSRHVSASHGRAAWDAMTDLERATAIVFWQREKDLWEWESELAYTQYIGKIDDDEYQATLDEIGEQGELLFEQQRAWLARSVRRRIGFRYCAGRHDELFKQYFLNSWEAYQAYKHMFGDNA